MVARFSTVVLDVDSTLSGVEGIDWLAGRRGPVTAEFVRQLTQRAMNGELTLEEAYAQRMELVAPTLAEVHALADCYRARVAPGAQASIALLHRSDVRVVAISGGLREAILPLARDIGIEDDDVHAVGVRFTEGGDYLGYDRSSPLTTQLGKAALLNGLALSRPILAVGDGSTDLAMKTGGAADTFAAFVGYVRREQVVASADGVLASFAELAPFVMSAPS